MSRVAKNPIVLPQGVEVTLGGAEISVKGPLGVMKMAANSAVKIEKEAGALVFSAVEGAENSGALSGTLRAVVANMVTGVTTGFSTTLELVGTGYRVRQAGNKLVLSLGFSHEIEYPAPAGIDFKVEGTNLITVSGFDKQLVGQVAAEIRGYKKPEPYKGKGVRYQGEVVRRKAGKAAKAAA